MRIGCVEVKGECSESYLCPCQALPPPSGREFSTTIMSTTLSSTETYSLLSLSLACIGIVANTLQGDGNPLIASIAFSGLAFASSYALVRWLGKAFIARGFKGRDLCKLKQTEMWVLESISKSGQLTVAVLKLWAPCVPWSIFSL